VIISSCPTKILKCSCITVESWHLPKPIKVEKTTNCISI